MGLTAPQEGVGSPPCSSRAPGSVTRCVRTRFPQQPEKAPGAKLEPQIPSLGCPPAGIPSLTWPTACPPFLRRAFPGWTEQDCQASPEQGVAGRPQALELLSPGPGEAPSPEFWGPQSGQLLFSFCTRYRPRPQCIPREFPLPSGALLPAWLSAVTTGTSSHLNKPCRAPRAIESQACPMGGGGSWLWADGLPCPGLGWCTPRRVGMRPIHHCCGWSLSMCVSTDSSPTCGV